MIKDKRMERKKLVCCGVLKRELSEVFKRLNMDVKVKQLTPGLHVDIDKLEEKVTDAVEEQKPKTLIYGRKCHPTIDWQQKYSLKQPEQNDCIGILIGEERKKELSQEKKTFFMSPGWLEHWRTIFKKGLGWYEVDARMNFGRYDRILLLDTGVRKIKDQEILEFFDYTQVPIEILSIDLTHLEKVIRGCFEIDLP